MTALDRRQFATLAAASTGAAALTAASSPAAAPSQPAGTPARGFRKAVKLGMVQEGDSIEAKFQLLVELGFDGVELDSPSNLDKAEVVAAQKATGLTIHGVVDSAHWRDTLSHPDAETRSRGVAALREALDDAALFGATTVLLVPAVVNKEVSYKAAYERSQAEIRKVLPKAQELGIVIALENVWNNFLLSPLEAAQYIDSFESEWIGAYLDCGNLVRYGWPEHWIEALGPRILKVDVKDYSRKKQRDEGIWRGFDVAIGDGDTDWPAVVKALRGIGYDGWFTAEVGGGARDHLADIARRMNAFL